MAPDRFPYRRGDVLLHNSQNLLKEHWAITMTMSTHLSPLVALIVGILILIFPRFLNYFIAVYLIVTGLIGLGALRSIGSP